MCTAHVSIGEFIESCKKVFVEIRGFWNIQQASHQYISFRDIFTPALLISDGFISIPKGMYIIPYNDINNYINAFALVSARVSTGS